MYTIITPKKFLKNANRFFKKHPEPRPRFARVVEKLKNDPFEPTLGLHPPSGRLKDLHAVSITGSCRTTLTIKIVEGEILLLDIGSHDEVYR